MKLNELFKNTPEIEIENIMVDSRQRSKHAIFFCCKGLMNDGHKFIAQAIKNGAIVVVHSDDLEHYEEGITYIRVEDTTRSLNKVASIFFGHPSHSLRMFGVTGTNGKSSVTSLIRDLSEGIFRCGYIGTISIEYGDVKLPPLLTTPTVVDLQHILSDMKKAKMEACALEVSSIGLEQGRVDAVDFDVAVFTNLTHDHLDYHGTMENYFLAKKTLFDNLDPDKVAIVNVDDPHGKAIVADCPARIYTYGIEKEADYRARDIQILADKTIFTLSYFSNEYRIETNLVATFNIYNLLAAIAALNQSGVGIDEMLGKLNNIRQIEGRMERVEEGQPFNIIVDFAHTPDGLQQIFEFAAKITPVDRRIIAVFGSAGKRDTKKRPIFGALADKYCDMIILTEDDPRGENPIEIAEDIAKGIKKTNMIIIENRYDAIRQAIEMANIQDTILLLGKGDESFMYGEFGREPWMGDQNAARDVLHKYYFENEEEIL